MPPQKKRAGHCHKVNQLNRGTIYFKIFHQNIRELGKKTVEHLHPDFPHVLCLTEHHLKYLQLEKFHIENYNLGAHYCRQLCEKVEWLFLFIIVSSFSNIDMAQHCKEQDIEICALKLSFDTLKICILTLYKASSGNFDSFLLKLDTILQSLYTLKLHFIICGDININYLNEIENKNQLVNLLLSCNLINNKLPNESTDVLPSPTYVLAII